MTQNVGAANVELVVGDRAEAVKRGVLLMGGYPVELPAMSVG